MTWFVFCAQHLNVKVFEFRQENNFHDRLRPECDAGLKCRMVKKYLGVTVVMSRGCMSDGTGEVVRQNGEQFGFGVMLTMNIANKV